MTNPSEDLLVAPEGVDEGSAASTAEGPASGSDGDLVGADAQVPETESTPRPPDDMESEESRAARDAAGTGQQLQAGEG